MAAPEVEAGAAVVGVVVAPEAAAVPEAPALGAVAPIPPEAERADLPLVGPVVTPAVGAPPVAEVPPVVGARPAEE